VVFRISPTPVIRTSVCSIGTRSGPGPRTGAASDRHDAAGRPDAGRASARTVERDSGPGTRGTPDPARAGSRLVDPEVRGRRARAGRRAPARTPRSATP
jgi:hypothetical protein